jgi:hypothetical protein
LVLTGCNYNTFDIRYNCGFTATDPALIAFLNSKNPGWTAEQNQCSFLIVTSPNGGEAWQAGSMQDITWDSIGSEDFVKINYSSDNGENWTEVISSTENNGIYNWTVPFVTSTNCLVRIEEVGGLLSDFSDVVFTICPNSAGWTPVEGMQNSMVAYGNAYHGIAEAAVGDWIGAFGPGGVSDCRAVAQIGADGNYYLTVRSNADHRWCWRFQW